MSVLWNDHDSKINSIKGYGGQENNPTTVSLKLNIQIKLKRDMSVSSDCKDSAITWDTKTHEISLRNEWKGKRNLIYIKREKSFFNSCRVTETSRRLWSQRAAGLDLTSTGVEPKATWLWGCLSERWSRFGLHIRSTFQHVYVTCPSNSEMAHSSGGLPCWVLIYQSVWTHSAKVTQHQGVRLL